MITAELGAATPAIEIVEWSGLAAAGRRHPRWGDTGPAARAVLAHPDVQLLAAVLPAADSAYTPDLLTPGPEVDTAARSTSELSRRHGLAPATVPYHLGVLLRAGLVTGARERNLVYYRRNAPADTLLGDALDGRRQPAIRATGR